MKSGSEEFCVNVSIVRKRKEKKGEKGKEKRNSKNRIERNRKIKARQAA